MKFVELQWIILPICNAVSLTGMANCEISITDGLFLHKCFTCTSSTCTCIYSTILYMYHDIYAGRGQPGI